MIFNLFLLTAASLSMFATEVVAQKCRSQSCFIAAMSGSTKTNYTLPGGAKSARGGSAAGERCIRRIRTEFSQEAKARQAGQAPAVDAPRRTASKDCHKTTLIFARGTTESGPYGGTVGKALAKQVRRVNGWGTRGISEGDNYYATQSGNDCLGLPGGQACVKVLSQLAATCADSTFIISGYSQGAMVARNCAAYSIPQIQERIKAVILFGDPMNGADIEGVADDRILSICKPTDGVCGGKLAITPGHLSYPVDGSIAKAMAFAKKSVAMKGDSSVDV